jgi:lysophospholipase L1-like esterase
MLLLLSLNIINARNVSKEYENLGIDTSYCYLQFSDSTLAGRLASHFQNVDSDKVVIMHFGDSHIQAEYPTAVARNMLQYDFGDGGRGMLFTYSAAKTYSTVNYKTSKKGNWIYAKSFILPPKLPLGVCGMAVETTDKRAELNIEFKQPVRDNDYEVSVFFENSPSASDFVIYIDSARYVIDSALRASCDGNVLKITYQGEINGIDLKVTGKTSGKTFFRFYGLNIETVENKGVVYHSLGVGASQMRSVLYLEKMVEQAKMLNPDVVLLDFGTNDIYYKNAIEPNMSSQIVEAIQLFREINPEIIIILTSTQDLWRRGRYITAGPEFRNLVDSVAREHGCMFWNWYDLSGGLHTIKTWSHLGYAQPDCVHLTLKGYELKGELLYTSFKNTLDKICNEPEITALTVTNKDYKGKFKDDYLAAQMKTTVHVVRKGDTLSHLARRYRSTVNKIRMANNLRSDMIRVGQRLEIPVN